MADAADTPEREPTSKLRRLGREAGRAVAGVFDLVFPPACVSCHGLIESAGAEEDRAAGVTPRPAPAVIPSCPNLCDGCRRRVHLVQAPHCTTCGHPFFGDMERNIGCPHCETLRPAFGEGRTATLLQGPMRDVVHGIKYRQWLHALDDVAGIVAAHAYFRAFFQDAVLVPVPLHSRKRRERGFNQAELLAEVFSRAVPGARIQPLLERVIDTPTQTRLDREQRRANLKNAFALAPGAPLETRTRHVLVDDVFTTGATLNACAVVLRRAGLTAVDVATLGHG